MSRRDDAIVAWHEVPGRAPPQKIRPVPSPCESYDLRDSPFRVFAPKKSFSPPPCSIPSFIRPSCGGRCQLVRRCRFGAGQARARFEEAVLQQIGTQVAEQLERRVTNQQLWLGRRVKITDGTCLSMPDTAANQLQWPQNSNQKPGCGFPQSKWSAFFACKAERFCRWPTTTSTITSSSSHADFGI